MGTPRRVCFSNAITESVLCPSLAKAASTLGKQIIHHKVLVQDACCRTVHLGKGDAVLSLFNP